MNENGKMHNMYIIIYIIIYFLYYTFFPDNSKQKRLHEKRYPSSLSRFLTNSSSYGVGWLRKTEPISTRRPDGYHRRRRYRRDVTYLREKKIGATRGIFRSYLQIPPGRRPARLHSRSQFAGTLDADGVFLRRGGIHY